MVGMETYVLVQFKYTPEFRELFHSGAVTEALDKLCELICYNGKMNGFGVAKHPSPDQSPSRRETWNGIQMMGVYIHRRENNGKKSKFVPLNETISITVDELVGHLYDDRYFGDDCMYTVYKVSSIDHFVRYIGGRKRHTDFRMSYLPDLSPTNKELLDFNYPYDDIREIRKCKRGADVYILNIVEPEESLVIPSLNRPSNVWRRELSVHSEFYNLVDPDEEECY